jgi:hypothetical protein
VVVVVVVVCNNSNEQELLCGKSVKHEGHILSIASLLQVLTSSFCHSTSSPSSCTIKADALGGFPEVFLKGLSLHHLSLGR